MYKITNLDERYRGGLFETTATIEHIKDKDVAYRVFNNIPKDEKIGGRREDIIVFYKNTDSSGIRSRWIDDIKNRTIEEDIQNYIIYDNFLISQDYIKKSCIVKKYIMREYKKSMLID